MSKLFYYLFITLLTVFALLTLIFISRNLDFGNNSYKKEITFEEKDSINIGKESALASIDPQFIPNPVIEGFVLLNHRGKEYELDLNHPSFDSIFISQNDKTNILFSGVFPKLSENIEFRIKLYSNDESEYNNDQPLLDQQVKTEINKENKSYFNINLEVSFPPGLYYFVLETIEEEYFIIGGRFKIVQ